MCVRVCGCAYVYRFPGRKLRYGYLGSGNRIWVREGDSYLSLHTIQVCFELWHVYVL